MISKLVRRSFIDALALGIFIGILSLLIFIWIIDLGRFDDIWEANAFSLLGTLATLFVGFLALKSVQDQIEQNHAIFESQRLDELRAAKSTLPVALSDICEISANNMRRHFEASDLFDHSITNEFHTMSENLILIIQRCIQLDNGFAGNILSNILKSYQVLYARSRDKKNNKKIASGIKLVGRDYEKVADAINWAVLYSLTTSLFDYARGRNDKLPPKVGPEQVMSAFMQSGIIHDNFPDIEKLVEQRAARCALEMNFSQ
jgi:hypothetical protein